MGNALINMADLLNPPQISTLTGVVIGIKQDQVQVRFPSNTVSRVWGKNISIGDTVLVKDKVIIAKIASENVPRVFIP